MRCITNPSKELMGSLNLRLGLHHPYYNRAAWSSVPPSQKVSTHCSLYPITMDSPSTHIRSRPCADSCNLIVVDALSSVKVANGFLEGSN